MGHCVRLKDYLTPATAIKARKILIWVCWFLSLVDDSRQATALHGTKYSRVDQEPPPRPPSLKSVT